MKNLIKKSNVINNVISKFSNQAIPKDQQLKLKGGSEDIIIVTDVIIG